MGLVCSAVQGKVGRRKLPLRQLGSEHVYRVISAREVLVKIESRKPCGLRLLLPCPRRVCFVGACLKRRILLQRYTHRLLQRERLSAALFLRMCPWRHTNKENRSANERSSRVWQSILESSHASSGDSLRNGRRLEPTRRFFVNLVRRLKYRAFLQHRANGAVFFFG